MAKQLTEAQKEAEWQATNDANTLAEANVILSDEKRLNAARKSATKLAKEAKARFDGMLKVAGKGRTTIEGMKVLNKGD